VKLEEDRRAKSDARRWVAEWLAASLLFAKEGID
jgi:hypothetical protein